MLNFLAFIGWNPGGDKEVYTKEEMIVAFSLEGVQKGSAGYNLEKLNWFNREHMKLLPKEELAGYVRPYIEKIENFNEDIFQKILPILTERISRFGELDQMIEDGEVGYYFNDPEYADELLVWKKSDAAGALEHLKYVYEDLQTYNGDWTSDVLKEELWPYAEEKGKGDVLWPLRVSLSGREKSPDPFALLGVFGKDESLRRIAMAIGKLEE